MAIACLNFIVSYWVGLARLFANTFIFGNKKVFQTMLKDLIIKLGLFSLYIKAPSVTIVRHL